MDIKFIIQSKGFVILSTLLRIIVIRKIFGQEIYVWFVTETASISILLTVLSAGSLDLVYNRLSSDEGVKYFWPLLIDNILISIITIILGLTLGFHLFMIIFLLSQRAINFTGLVFRAQNAVLFERKIYLLSSLLKIVVFGIAFYTDIQFKIFLYLLGLTDLSVFIYFRKIKFSSNSEFSLCEMQKQKLKFISTNVLTNILIYLPITVLNKLAVTDLFLESWSYMEQGLKSANIIFASDGSLRLRSLIQKRRYIRPVKLYSIVFVGGILGIVLLFYYCGIFIVYPAICLTVGLYFGSAVIYPLVYSTENFRVYNYCQGAMVTLLSLFYLFEPPVIIALTIVYPSLSVLINIFLFKHYRMLSGGVIR